MGTDEGKPQLTIRDQNRWCRLFFEQCMQTFSEKEQDYAPENIPLLDVLGTAVEETLGVLTVLRILHRKHVTAVRRFELFGELTGEDIGSRLADIANYQALQYFYICNAPTLHRQWQSYWETQPCKCETDRASVPVNGWCERCQTLVWLKDFQPSDVECPPPPAPSA